MNTFRHSIANILSSRELASVSGAPLYSYKLSDIEYQNLYHSLLDSLKFQRITSYIPSGMSSDWSGAFVLYAAEWWRKEFNGGHWSWEPIFRSLNVVESEINANQRNQIIAAGFRYWRRPLLTNGQGRMFLGSVAVEGGLPLKLITDPNSKLSHYFEQVIKDFGKFTLSKPNAMLIAEAHDNYIAASFRTEAVYSVVGKIAEAIYQLTDQYSLDEQQDPISFLDAIAPNWPESLPLNIDMKVAKGLLNSALGQAIEVQRRLPSSIRLVRRLAKTFDRHTYSMDEPNLDQARWSCQLSVSLRSKINVQYIQQTFEIQSLPARFSLFALGKKPLLLAKAFRPKNNPDRYLLDVLTTELPEDWFDCEIQLMLRCENERAWYAPLLGGSHLSVDEPWVFTENEGDWILAGAGDISCEATTAVIALPHKTTDDEMKNGDSFGLTDNELPRKLLKLKHSGTYSFNYCDVVLGCADKNQCEYAWQGEELPYQTLPTKCYIGKPSLLAVSLQGVQQLIPKEKLRWHHVSKNQWLPFDTLPFGQSEVAYFDEGKAKKRFRVASLPNDLSLEFVSGDKFNSGQIIISSSRPPMVALNSSESETLHYQVKQELRSITVDLFSAQEQPPALVSLSLWWQDQPKAISLTLPFPSKGVCLLDSEQKQVDNNSSLLLEKLNGYELYGYGIEGEIQLQFLLKAPDVRGNFSRTAYFTKILPSVEALSSGLSLSTFRSDIHSLFALSSHLDAVVNVKVMNNSRELFSCNLSSYVNSLVPERDTGRIKLTGTIVDESVDLFIVPLDRPDQMPLQLLPATDFEENVERRWVFPDVEVEPAAWLVFCSNPKLGIRPLMWSKDLELLPQARNGFEVAAGIGHRGKRIDAFSFVAKELVTDYARPEWDYVRTLLKLDSVPFTTFDLWRGVTREPEFMLALLLKANKKEVDQVWRLDTQFPILWYSLKLETSLKVVNAFYQDLLRRLGDEMEDVAQARVQKKLTELVAFFPGFEPFSTMMLYKIGLIADKPSLALPAYMQHIYDCRNSLSQRNLDASWPTVFANEIIEAVISKVNPQFVQVCLTNQFSFKNNAMNAPVLLALAGSGQAALSITPEVVHAMREYRGFDSEYFDESFALTQKMIIGLTKI